jgi:YbbR domain-containing protein
MKTSWIGFFTNNASYKLVSLFIALILWITIMGRRDFTLTRSLDLEVFPAPGYIVESQSVERLKIKVNGSRTALRRFVETEGSQVVGIDMSGFTEGIYEVEIPSSKVEVPFGVKILSLTPARMQVRLKRKD